MDADSEEAPFRAIDLVSVEDFEEFDDWNPIASDDGALDSVNTPLGLNEVEESCERDEIAEVDMREELSLPLDSSVQSTEFQSVPDVSLSSVEWNQMIASSFGQYRANHAGLTFPWETGVLADIFGSTSSLSLPQCVGTELQLLDSSTLPETAQSIGNALDVLPTDAKYTQAVQSLKDVPYFEGKAHKLELACGVWMDILSTDWKSSDVGQMLAQSLLADATGSEAVEILRACFGVKSPSTLIKRACAFKRFMQWHFKSGYGTTNNCLAFPLQEKAVWEYWSTIGTCEYRPLSSMRRDASRGSHQKKKRKETNNDVVFCFSVMSVAVLSIYNTCGICIFYNTTSVMYILQS